MNLCIHLSVCVSPNELTCNWFGSESESVPNRCAFHSFFCCCCWSLDAPTYTHTHVLWRTKRNVIVYIHMYVCIVCRDMFESRPSSSPGRPTHFSLIAASHFALQTDKQTCVHECICVCVCACILSILFYVHLFTVLDSEICTAGSDRQGTELTFSQIANEYVFFQLRSLPHSLTHTHTCTRAPRTFIARCDHNQRATQTQWERHASIHMYICMYVVYAWIHTNTSTYAYICMHMCVHRHACMYACKFMNSSDPSTCFDLISR